MRNRSTGGAGRILWAALSALLLTGCSGLPSAREMGDMALLRTVGVDAAPAGVAVTGSTGPRAKGLQAEGEPSLILGAEESSLSGACLAMQGQSDSYVFFGYVDQLLVGEALAEQGLQSVLDFFARDLELSLGAQLWLIRGADAREAVAAGGEKGTDSRLENLQHDSKMGIASISRTAGEVYADLLERGSAFVPALSPAGDESAVLNEDGYAVLRGKELAGFLDGEAARGLELLAGGVRADVLAVELPDNPVSVKITSTHTRSSLEFQDGTPSALKLTCVAAAQLSEYQTFPNGGELEQIREELCAREKKRLETALEQLRAWRTDCTGLGAGAGMLHPLKWRAIHEDWPSWFAQIPIEVTVQIKLDS